MVRSSLSHGMVCYIILKYADCRLETEDLSTTQANVGDIQANQDVIKS